MSALKNLCAALLIASLSAGCALDPGDSDDPGDETLSSTSSDLTAARWFHFVDQGWYGPLYISAGRTIEVYTRYGAGFSTGAKCYPIIIYGGRRYGDANSLGYARFHAIWSGDYYFSAVCTANPKAGYMYVNYR